MEKVNSCRHKKDGCNSAVGEENNFGENQNNAEVQGSTISYCRMTFKEN